MKMFFFTFSSCVWNFFIPWHMMKNSSVFELFDGKYRIFNQNGRNKFRGTGGFEAPVFSRHRWFRGTGGFGHRWFRGTGDFEAPVVSRHRWFRGTGGLEAPVVWRHRWRQASADGAPADGGTGRWRHRPIEAPANRGTGVICRCLPRHRSHRPLSSRILGWTGVTGLIQR